MSETDFGRALRRAIDERIGDGGESGNLCSTTFAIQNKAVCSEPLCTNKSKATGSEGAKEPAGDNEGVAKEAAEG